MAASETFEFVLLFMVRTRTFILACVYIQIEAQVQLTVKYGDKRAIRKFTFPVATLNHYELVSRQHTHIRTEIFVLFPVRNASTLMIEMLFRLCDAENVLEQTESNNNKILWKIKHTPYVECTTVYRVHFLQMLQKA